MTVLGPGAPVTLLPVDVCACGHPLGGHDFIASRYCRATLDGGIGRGCICLVLPDSAASSAEPG